MKKRRSFSSCHHLRIRRAGREVSPSMLKLTLAVTTVHVCMDASTHQGCNCAHNEKQTGFVVQRQRFGDDIGRLVSEKSS